MTCLMSGSTENSLTCVFKAAIIFKWGGTSFEGADKHADDPSKWYYATIKYQLCLSHVRLLCDDGESSSKVQRLHCMFYCSWFGFEYLLKLIAEGAAGTGITRLYEDEESRAKWPHLTGSRLGFLQTSAGNNIGTPGCQHTLQAQKIVWIVQKGQTL